jgi:hypothetical protein
VSSKKAPTTEVQCRLFLDGNSKRACAQVVNVRRRSARLEAQRVSDVEMRRFVFSEVVSRLYPVNVVGSCDARS